MAGAALAAVPIIIIFLIFQKYFTKGIAMVLSRAKISTAASGRNRENFGAAVSRMRGRPRAEADAGNRKRALLPFPERKACRA